jgi:hypothetical protein
MDSVFRYEAERKITKTELRATLAQVRDHLLDHRINGGGRELDMSSIIRHGKFRYRDGNYHGCGTAACIGGWAGVFLLGIEGKNVREQEIIGQLFEYLCDHNGARLSQLFHSYDNTINYNEPNVAATAIQRYLDGKVPWPNGRMPSVLPYTKPAKRTAKR